MMAMKAECERLLIIEVSLKKEMLYNKQNLGGFGLRLFLKVWSSRSVSNSSFPSSLQPLD
jgi:hypothetical protein